ncbi:DUF2231 domain-containing protein [Alkalicoccus chagannorensis]|uniref:DUF2231 domain-containing protein n=1 Tax=Alkalicoccus chagannorensis TaxID=427072 RepID=UPI00040DB63C|nr:DUF2231 domain-containing protein [Alkalicoccus chagannorensis]
MYALYIIPDPLHPAVVHIPIALWLVGSMFVVLSLFWQTRFFEQAAIWMLSIGTIGGVAAYVTGEDAVGVALQLYGDSVGEFLGPHQQFAFYSLITYIAVTVLQVFNFFYQNTYVRWGLAVLAVIGAVLTIITGHYAGRMMYDDV